MNMLIWHGSVLGPLGHVGLHSLNIGRAVTAARPGGAGQCVNLPFSRWLAPPNYQDHLPRWQGYGIWGARSCTHLRASCPGWGQRRSLPFAGPGWAKIGGYRE